MVIWLGLLLVVAIIVVFVWNYRRQTAARDAASAERMNAFMEQARGVAAANPAVADKTAVAATAPPPAGVSSAALGAKPPLPLVSGFKARAQLLSNEQRALHALLKSGLPDCEILAQVSLATFIQPAENLTGFAREAQERRLTDAVVDFLVCDQSMKALAGVQCGPRSGKAAETAAFAAACVLSTGIRWVEVAPLTLPRVDEIKRQVLGT
jgi:Protein of unknown function (DUF2726)